MAEKTKLSKVNTKLREESIERTNIDFSNTVLFHIKSVFKSSLIYYLTSAGFFIVSIIAIVFSFSAYAALFTIVFSTLFIYVAALLLTSYLLHLEDKAEPLSKENRTIYKFDFFYHLLLNRLGELEFDEFKDEFEEQKEENIIDGIDINQKFADKIAEMKDRLSDKIDFY